MSFSLFMKMYMQENFFKEQIKIIHETRDEKEESFERLQQEQREKIKLLNANPSSADESSQR
jgi:hypothetical protein